MGDNKLSLTLAERVLQGKKVKQLRKESLVPMVVYGAGMEPRNVQAGYNEVAKVVQAAGKHAPVHLNLGDKKKIAMVKEVSIDPARHMITHVAWHAVKQNQPIVAEVPVVLDGEGESEAEKAGLIILQNIDSLEVKALPMEMPDSLVIDIRGLKEAGEKVIVADIKLPANVELVDKAAAETENEDEEDQQSIMDLQVASVWEPSALQAANDATGGDATEDTVVEAENGAEAAGESEKEEK